MTLFDHIAQAALITTNWSAVFQARERNKAAASALHEQRREANATGIVLLITSQHPLVVNPESGRRDYPGLEYRARLERGVELATQWQAEDRAVTVITLGDLHRDDDGVPDDSTLHEAGVRYLRQLGLPDDLVLSQESADQHSTDGIYCTEDEVAVAAGVFRNDARMHMIASVCGQGQAMRVMLAGQNNGVPLQVSPPLVMDGNALADPAKFHHDPGVETIRVAPLDVIAPVYPGPFQRVRDAVKSGRQV